MLCTKQCDKNRCHFASGSCRIHLTFDINVSPYRKQFFFATLCPVLYSLPRMRRARDQRKTETVTRSGELNQ